MHNRPEEWDFEIQTDYLISARRSDLVIVKKKKKKKKTKKEKENENAINRGICRSDWSQGKTEGKRKER